MTEEHEKGQARTLAVGHFLNAPFVESCTRHLGRIREVFFAWPGVLSCRPAPDFTPEVRERMLSDLRWARDNGILLDTLFNCNCYGDIAISDELADFAGRMLGEMDAEGLFPDIVTTTSPFLATIFRRRFPSLKIRLSVNMRMHGTVGFEPIMDLFDSFYASRERHRELDWLAALSRWAKENGKILGMQVNSGCIRQCPFQQFHDNMHGHNRIAQSKVGEKFDFSVFLCRTNYERGRYEDFLRSTWIRPEDLPLYEEFADVVKIATRRHPHPVEVLDAYATYSYDGNLADLMDACHSFPKSFDNRSFDAVPGLWREVRGCARANDCAHCGKCAELMKAVFREGARTTGALAPPNPAQGAALPHSAPPNPAQGAALPRSAAPGQGPCGRATGALAPPNPACGFVDLSRGFGGATPVVRN